MVPGDDAKEGGKTWKHGLRSMRFLWDQIPALPLILLLGMFGLALLFIFNEVHKWPYVGATFSAQTASQSLLVDSVSPSGPADKAGLVKGDQVIALEDPKTQMRYKITGLEAISGRHQIHSYEEANRSRAAMEAAWKFLLNDTIVLHTKNGKTVQLTPSPKRPLNTLPLTVYTAMAQSFLVLMIASGIFFFAQRSISVTLLALSGFGLSINMLTNSMPAAREMVMSPVAIDLASSVNAVAAVTFSYSLLALLWHFPSRINAFPFAIVISLVGASILVAQLSQVYEFPIHAFQIPNLLPFPLAIIISFIQWRRSRDNPVERASIMWFILSIFGVTSLVVLFYSVPIMAGLPPLINPHFATFTLSFIYTGIALGTLKYRLFDMNAIWWKSIVWLLGGVVVFIVDILLISRFDLQQAQALPLAIFLAGWAYFPLRQAIIGLFIGSRETKLADHVSDMVNTFSRLDEIEEFEGRFVAFLSRVYMADDICRLPMVERKSAILKRNGLVLQVPKLEGNGAVELVGKANGRQLFSSNDVRIADGLTHLVRNMMNARKREMVQMSEDRERIVRDLHDDVGGKLLSLILKSTDKNTAHAARKTLAALKESLIVVENSQTISSSTAFEQITQDIRERTDEAGQDVEISSNIKTDRVLSAREYINLIRIAQEMVNNLIKYAEPKTAEISMQIDQEGAIEIFTQNGLGKPMEDMSSSGRGLASIKRRAEEIDGTIDINNTKMSATHSFFSIRLTVPFTH